MKEKVVQISQKGLYEGTQTYRKGLCVCICFTLPIWGGEEKQKKETLPGDVCK